MRPRKRKATQSLRYRILAPSCAITLGLILGLGLFARWHFAQSNLYRVEQRARSIATIIDRMAETADGVEDLRRSVAAHGQDRDVRSILIIDRSAERVIASTKPELLGLNFAAISPADLPIQLLHAGPLGPTAYRFEIEGDTATYQQPITLPPDLAEAEGEVFAQLDLAEANSQLERIEATSIALAAAVAVITAGTTLWLLERRVLRPIQLINAAVKEHVGDETAPTFPALAPDEIGSLAAALGSAFSQLNDRTLEAGLLARDLQFQKTALDQHAIVSETDATGRITYVNDAFCSISKYARDELLDQNHRIFNSDYHSVDFWRRMFSTVAKAGTWRAEVRCRAKDGSYFWLDTTIVAFRGKSGQIARYVSIRTDITARKLAEFDLIKANLKAEKSLAEAELARGHAEAAAQAKSQFLATMSHEIRTPMNGLIGVLHLLEDGVPASKANLLATAQRSADDLMELLNDILDFSKIEAGKMSLDEVAFDALELAEDVCALHAPTAHEKGLELACLCDPSLPIAARGDPRRIRQILSNLVGNAVKFTPRGSVTIHIARPPRADADGLDLSYSVIDTGIGIAAEAQGKLFDAFAQANSSTTRRFGGTGLGLAISRRLAEMMGGGIDFESAEGVGSTFVLALPQPYAQPASAPSPTPAELIGKRALLALEAGPTQRQIVAWLESWGIACVVAEQDAALELGHEEPFDFALFDKRTLDEQRDLIERLRQRPSSLANVRIIVTHTLTASASLELSAAAGPMVDCLLHKPVRLDDLRNALAPSSHAATRAGRSESNAAPPAQLADRSAYAVLLVDDNITNRMIGSQILKKRHGIAPETASNGLEAITALKQQRFDLVLMDCMMPEMDGYTAAQAIRDGLAGELNRSVPIVALTANAMSEDRDKCLAAGMSDYLPKPINPATLAPILERWLTQPKTDSEPAPADAFARLQGQLDINKLRTVYDGDDASVAEMLTLFVNGLAESIAQLKQAAQGPESADEMCFYAHRIRGSCAEFGARRLGSLASDIESLCKSGHVRDAADLVSLADEEAQVILGLVASIRP